MTIDETVTRPEEAPASRPTDGKLQARMWIGHNPVVFVVICLAAGYLLGRGWVRRKTS